MTDDIVTRLQDWQHIVDKSKGDAVVVMLSGQIFSDAANEIERLRAEIKRLRSVVVLCPRCMETDRG